MEVAVSTCPARPCVSDDHFINNSQCAPVLTSLCSMGHSQVRPSKQWVQRCTVSVGIPFYKADDVVDFSTGPIEGPDATTSSEAGNLSFNV